MDLFIYGTLLVPEIWNAVTSSPNHQSLPATLNGHAIRRVKNGDFPAIYVAPESTELISGRLIFNLTPTVASRLDSYEDTLYVREKVIVETDTGPREAETYRVLPEVAQKILSDEKWTLAWFEKEALTRYRHRVFGL
tara:strand:+ start:1899 stop:2309 length:411 start_codon:yes stop_codon:yes gene_type:complete